MTLPTWFFGGALSRSLCFWMLTLIGLATSAVRGWDGGPATVVFFISWSVVAFAWVSIEDDEIVEIEE
jgi:hypothetical protein